MRETFIFHRISIAAAIMLAVLLIFASARGALTKGPAWYTAIDGSTGLTVLAVDQDSCTGSPPSVTINGGVSGTAFTDLGGGVYFAECLEGWKYVFVDGALDGAYYQVSDSLYSRLSALEAAGNVSTTDLSTGCVTSAKIADGTIAAVDIASGAVTNSKIGSDEITTDKIAPGEVAWSDLNTTVTGFSPDNGFTIEEMQDTLRWLYDGVVPATDYNVKEMSDILKEEVLDLTLVADTITVALSGGRGSVRVRWDHTGLYAAENDTATRYWEVYWSESAPGFTASDSLTASDIANIANGMNLAHHYRPTNYYSQTRDVGPVDEGDSVYVVVVAWDWQGAAWGSGIYGGKASDGNVGSVDALIGADDYVAGMSGMDLVKINNDKINQLEAKVGASGLPPLCIVNSFTMDSLGVLAGVGNLPELKTEGLSSNVLTKFSYYTYAGYTKIFVTGKARVGSSGTQTGYVSPSNGGSAGTAATITATALTTFTTEVSIASFADDEVFTGWVSAIGATANDTIYVRGLTVWLR